LNALLASGSAARTPHAETSKPATARKPAAKAEDGERIDPPKPADDGALRGAREDLDIAHEEEEAERGKA
jgi:hypothetical protein